MPASESLPRIRNAEPGAVRPRRGLALLAVLTALALLGLMFAATVTVTLTQQRGERRDSDTRATFAAAEAARATALADWTAQLPPLLPVGQSVRWTAGAWNGATGDGVVTRLAPAVIRVEGVASRDDGSGTPLGTHAVAQLLSVAPPLLPIGAAVTLGAPVTVGASAGAMVRFDGRDTVVTGWACDPVDTATVASLASVTLPALPPAALRTPWQADSTAGWPARYRPLWLLPDTLRLARPLVFAGDLPGARLQPSTDSTGACRAGAADPVNWGDPARPSVCADWRPLVHVRGHLDAPTGVGQGLLMVDGDLRLTGGFEFWGVVVVRGRLLASGTGNRIVGALLAGGGGGVHQLDALSVRYASCVVRAALLAGGVLRPVPERGWSEWW